MTLKVLSLASEAVPLVKTGGLADVVGALPAALAAEGVEMTTMLPGYPAVMRGLGRLRKVGVHWPETSGMQQSAGILAGKTLVLTGSLPTEKALKQISCSSRSSLRGSYGETRQRRAKP